MLMYMIKIKSLLKMSEWMNEWIYLFSQENATIKTVLGLNMRYL